MKKFLCATASVIVAAFTFVFFSLTSFIGFSGNTTLKNYTVWEMLSDDVITAFNEFSFFNICSIISMVFAGLLVLMAIVLILQQLKIVKTKSNLCLVNSILLVIYTIAVVITFIAATSMASAHTRTALGITAGFKIGIGLILPMVVGAVMTIVSLLFSFSKKSKR